MEWDPKKEIAAGKEDKENEGEEVFDAVEDEERRFGGDGRNSGRNAGEEIGARN